MLHITGLVRGTRVEQSACFPPFRNGIKQTMISCRFVGDRHVHGIYCEVNHSTCHSSPVTSQRSAEWARKGSLHTTIAWILLAGICVAQLHMPVPISNICTVA